MKARQEVYRCFEIRRTLRAAKDERQYLLSSLVSVCHCLSLRPHDWLDSRKKFFGDLKLENEGGNLFSFNAPVDGRVRPQLL